SCERADPGLRRRSAAGMDVHDELYERSGGRHDGAPDRHHRADRQYEDARTGKRRAWSKPALSNADRRRSTRQPSRGPSRPWKIHAEWPTPRLCLSAYDLLGTDHQSGHAFAGPATASATARAGMKPIGAAGLSFAGFLAGRVR